MSIKTKTPVKSAAAPEGNFIKSLLEPGNYKVKLLNIYLQPNINNPEYGDKLVLKVETEPIEGKFKGLFLDKTDESKGTYKGRVGFISYDKFPFKDWSSPTGDFFVEKEIELQVAIQDICHALKIGKWYEDQDSKAHADMATFIKAFDEEKPFKDIYFNVCIAGKEYIAQGKYTNYELYFPKVMRDLGLPYNLDESKVQKYFSHIHLDRLKTKEVDSTTPTITAEEPKTIKAEPVKPKITSQAEANFMNEGKAKINSPFTEELEHQTEGNDIITGNDNEKLPWE